MRVTNNMMINNFLLNFSKNTQRLDNLQQILASGKLIRYPSDDPVGTVTVMKLNKDVSSIAQYKKNVDDADSWLNLTDTAIKNVNDVLARVRELLVEGSNSPTETKDIVSEINQLKKQLVNVGNTRYSDRYIFGGTKTTTEAYTLDEGNGPNGGVTYNGSNSESDGPWEIKFNVGADDQVTINVTGDKIFGDTKSGDNIFKLFDDIAASLEDGSVEKVSSYIEDLDKHIDNILAVRADTGARSNRVELTKNRLADDKINFTNLLANAEDADIAKTIMDISNAVNVYTSSLNVGARIIQPSLVDFLL